MTAPRKAATGTTRKATGRTTLPRVDLDLDQIAYAKKPSMTFRLSGREFRCLNSDDIHWGTIEAWMVARATGDPTAIAQNIDDIMSAVLFPDDVDAFLEAKRDPAGGLTVARQTALLTEVNRQVLGVTAVDPTQQPSPSPAGSRKTASTRKAASSAKRDGRSVA